MTEERLEAIAKRLGDEAAERIDVEETARAVVSRLRAEDRPRVWIPRFLQVAAVAVLAVGVGMFSLRGVSNTRWGKNLDAGRVVPKMPLGSATPSPRITTFGSRCIASRIAAAISSLYFIPVGS